MIDVSSLYRDFKVPIGPAAHKHSRRGWINVSCPFCTGNFGYHMGYNLRDGYFRCYRCGWHPVYKVVGELTGIRGEAQKQLLKKYWVEGAEEDDRVQTYAETLVYPLGCGPMTRIHKIYLMNRGFDASRIEREWGLMGTNHLDRDYKFRIIAPVLFQGRDVTFQGRDITDKQAEKYKACPQEKEVIHHKHILYGWDKAQWDKCLVCEGITGSWRFGPGALGTFGAQYKKSQLRLIASRYKRVFLCHDQDEAGMIAQDKMSIELEVMGVETILLDLTAGDDSGSIDQAEATQFMEKEIRN